MPRRSERPGLVWKPQPSQTDEAGIIPADVPVAFCRYGFWLPGHLTGWRRDVARYDEPWYARIRYRHTQGYDDVDWYEAAPEHLLKLEVHPNDRDNWLPPRTPADYVFDPLALGAYRLRTPDDPPRA